MAGRGAAIRRYIGVTAIGHLLWEVIQLPLYTLWREGSPGEIAFATLHCTAGDLLIALASLAGAWLLAGAAPWPARRFFVVAALTVALGVGYTLYSEWINVSVRGSWTYAPAMPRLPLLGTGLTPLLQWIAIPPLALWAARRAIVRESGTA